MSYKIDSELDRMTADGLKVADRLLDCRARAAGPWIGVSLMTTSLRPSCYQMAPDLLNELGLANAEIDCAVFDDQALNAAEVLAP